MATITINCLTRDYLCLQASIFHGNTSLAWQARQLFMHTRGITSFEVSPYTGKVFIGVDRHVMSDDGSNQEAMALLQDFFPELTQSQQFHRLYHHLH